MIDSFLNKFFDSIIGLVISRIWRNPPHLDVYANKGLLVIENNEEEAVLNVLVTSVRSKECHIDVDHLDPAVDQKAWEKAFAYLTCNGGEPHQYPSSGRDTTDERYRIFISRVPKGTSKYYPPHLETRGDSFAVFEVVFQDYRGCYWLKRPGRQPKRLWKREVSRLMQSGVPNCHSTPVT